MRPGFASRVNCYCSDCRAFVAHVGAKDAVDKNGAVELALTLPGRVSFTQGVDQLRAVRFSKRGPVRWYASCCGTPMGNVLSGHSLRFVSLSLAAIPDPEDRKPLGRLVASLHRDAAPKSARPPKRDYGAARLFYAIVVRHVGSLLGKAPDGSPYFTESGEPVGPVKILNAAEKACACKAIT